MKTKFVIGLLGLILLFAGWVALFGFSFIRHLDGLRPAYWAFIVLGVVGGVALLIQILTKGNGVIPLIMGGIALVGVAIYAIAVQSYVVNHKYYDSATIEDEAVTSYLDRAPWVVANNYASRDQGEDVGDRGRVKHVPTGPDESSRYTTLITGRAVLGNTGYSSIREYDLPKVGAISSSTSNSCEFPEAMGKRLGTLFPHRSIARELSFKNPLLHWNGNDVYAYCNGENPVVVIPLWEYNGVFVPVKEAAGAAVYRSSEVEILTPSELVEENILGPTFPLSLAEKQRVALKASGSLGDWYSSRSGYDTTDKDDEDTNVGNTSEFTLLSQEGDLHYVTPLVPRGTSQSITAVMVRPAQQVPGAENMRYTIETSTNLPSTSTIDKNLRSYSVRSDPEWSTRWASGMTVYEIVPTSDGHWVASVGLGQTVNYRADIAPDGSFTVTRTDDGEKEELGDEETVSGVLDKPLEAMTEEELVKLITDAARELEARSTPSEEPELTP